MTAIGTYDRDKLWLAFGELTAWLIAFHSLAVEGSVGSRAIRHELTKSAEDVGKKEKKKTRIWAKG